MLLDALALYALLGAANAHNVSVRDTPRLHAVLAPTPTTIGITEATGLGALLHTAYQARPPPSS